MTDATDAPEHVPSTVAPTPEAAKDGVVKKLGNGLLWLNRKGGEMVQAYPRTAFYIMVALVVSRIFV